MVLLIQQHHSWFPTTMPVALLVDSETIKVTVTTRGNQVCLTAAARTVGAVKRIGILPPTLAIEVTHLCRTLTITGPVVTGVISAVIDGPAVNI